MADDAERFSKADAPSPARRACAVEKREQRRCVLLGGLSSRGLPEISNREKTQRHDFPPDPKFVRESVYVHDLNKLLVAAGLESTLNMAVANNAALKTNWAVVKDWKVESRYLVSGLNGDALYRAAAGRNGVLRWLRQHW